ncbi:unnamed protein product [Musa banksii]
MASPHQGKSQGGGSTVALRDPERGGHAAVLRHQGAHLAVEHGVEVADLDEPHLHPHPGAELHLEVKVRPLRLLFPVEHGHGAGVGRFAAELRAERGGVLVVLVEGRERRRLQQNPVVEGGNHQGVIVDADALVGVAEGEADGEVEEEGGGVVGEAERHELGLLDGRPGEARVENEPPDQDDEAEGDDELNKAAEEFAAAAAAATAGGVAAATGGVRHDVWCLTEGESKRGRSNLMTITERGFLLYTVIVKEMYTASF